MTRNDYLKLIIEMLNDLDDSDNRFTVQLYTIIKLHMDKKNVGLEVTR